MGKRTLKELSTLVGSIATCDNRDLLDEMYDVVFDVIAKYYEELYELYKGKVEEGHMSPVHTKKLNNLRKLRFVIIMRLRQLGAPSAHDPKD